MHSCPSPGLRAALTLAAPTTPIRVTVRVRVRVYPTPTGTAAVEYPPGRVIPRARPGVASRARVTISAPPGPAYFEYVSPASVATTGGRPGGCLGGVLYLSGGSDSDGGRGGIVIDMPWEYEWARDCPQQADGSIDCGVFTILALMAWLGSGPLDFDQARMDEFRTALVWLMRVQVGHLHPTEAFPPLPALLPTDQPSDARPGDKQQRSPSPTNPPIPAQPTSCDQASAELSELPLHPVSR